MKKNDIRRLSDDEIEKFKLDSERYFEMGFTSNIERSIALSNLVMTELLERILDELKKK